MFVKGPAPWFAQRGGGHILHPIHAPYTQIYICRVLWSNQSGEVSKPCIWKLEKGFSFCIKIAQSIM